MGRSLFKKKLGTTPEPAFSQEKMRVLFLDGDKGSVGCRVKGDLTRTTPHFSEHYRVELASRSLARMRNLSAIRGTPGASMVGPADYYGNLEAPHDKLYTIDINNGVPMVYHQSRESPLESIEKEQILPENIVSVDARWISGKDKAGIAAALPKYTGGQSFGESLFDDPGILEIQGEPTLRFTAFDATKVDLSSFKARLVANDKPFKITDANLPPSDEYRAVSFLYEPEYGSNQVTQGGGLFLETHSFAQTITPLDEHAKGFVTLGRWAKNGKLELISFEVPYGFTLIVEENSIHGDATLNGMFMMCMTSNHITMQSADSVFLKNPDVCKNVDVVMDGSILPQNPTTPLAPRPYVMHDCRYDVSDFLKETKDLPFIFNPFSKGYWKRAIGLIIEWKIPQDVFGAFVAAVGIAAVVVAFGALNAVTLGIPGLCLAGAGVVAAIVGVGLFTEAKLQQWEDETYQTAPLLA